jgi:hypothetical protein
MGAKSVNPNISGHRYCGIDMDQSNTESQFAESDPSQK